MAPRPTSTSVGPPWGLGPAWERPGPRPAKSPWPPSFVVVAAEQPTEQPAAGEAAEHRAFLAPAAASLRCGREHARCQARERQALQPHGAGARHLREEQ